MDFKLLQCGNQLTGQIQILKLFHLIVYTLAVMFRLEVGYMLYFPVYFPTDVT